jgi:hypothetical protein
VVGATAFSEHSFDLYAFADSRPPTFVEKGIPSAKGAHSLLAGLELAT